MENNESVEPEATENLSENSINRPEKQFDDTDLTDTIKASLLNDITETAPSEAENTEETPTADEGVQEEEVLSQSEEEVTATAEQETEDEQEIAQPTEPDEDVDRGLPKGVKKRIDKLVAKRREAEDEIARLRAENERLSHEAQKPAQIHTDKKNPYSNLETTEQIQSEYERAKQIRRWCELHPEGGVVKDAKGNETEYTAEEVRNIKIRALDALEEYLPAQIQYIQNAMAVEQVATKEYPWWKDRSSSERQIAEAFLTHFPEIKRFPDYKMVLGDYIRGVKARESNKKTAPQRPPSQPKLNASPTAVKGATRKFTPSSGIEDLSDIISQRFI